MKNYEYEQNKNYESTKQMFEECRKDVGVSKGVKRAIPVVDDEICFFGYFRKMEVCITSQFENGLCRRNYLVPERRRHLYAAQQYSSCRSYSLASDGQERQK